MEFHWGKKSKTPSRRTKQLVIPLRDVHLCVLQESIIQEFNLNEIFQKCKKLKKGEKPEEPKTLLQEAPEEEEPVGPHEEEEEEDPESKKDK